MMKSVRWVRLRKDPLTRPDPASIALTARAKILCSRARDGAASRVNNSVNFALSAFVLMMFYKGNEMAERGEIAYQRH
jgi:hypothetical protein